MIDATKKVMTKWEFRFKEQDGDWSPWYACSEQYARSQEDLWDVEVRSYE